MASFASASSTQGIAAPALAQTQPKTDTTNDAPIAASDAVSGRYGYKNRIGAWVISPNFKSVSEFSGGLAFVENVDGSAGLVDTKGVMLTPNVQPAIWVSEPTLTEAKFAEGLLAARDMVSNKVGFLDARGRWVIRPRFADAYEFHEGLAAFRLAERGRVGFIDRRGRVIIAAKFGTHFRAPPVFSEKLAAVGLNDDWPRTNLDPPGKLGYIDQRGRWVIPAKYASGQSFTGGTARVTLGAQEIVIKHPLRP